MKKQHLITMPRAYALSEEDGKAFVLHRAAQNLYKGTCSHFEWEDIGEGDSYQGAIENAMMMDMDFRRRYLSHQVNERAITVVVVIEILKEQIEDWNKKASYHSERSVDEKLKRDRVHHALRCEYYSGLREACSITIKRIERNHYLDSAKDKVYGQVFKPQMPPPPKINK